MTAAMSQSLNVLDLRKQSYNATLVELRHIHDDLAIFRIAPDNGSLSFVPGQYATLGLGMWEDRVPGCQNENLTLTERERLVRRAYSVSSPVCDEHGIVMQESGAILEFYISLVRSAKKRPPSLTPRLFNMRVGDRLHLGGACHGTYTLDGVEPTDAVVFVATGTGEAPHNSMIAELIRRGHHAPIVSVVCTRLKQDLGYLAQHHFLERTHRNYSYLTLTTRESENLDPKHPEYVGKQYIQDYFSTGEFESDLGISLGVEATKFYLCGNPAMIGAPSKTEPSSGMVSLLERRGFKIDKPGSPGNVHFEKYW